MTKKGTKTKLITADGVAIKSMQLYVPKDALTYRARKTQQLLHIYDAQLLKDCTKINPKDYLIILKEYTDLTGQLKQKGYINGSRKKAQKGMDAQAVDGASASLDKDLFSE